MVPQGKPGLRLTFQYTRFVSLLSAFPHAHFVFIAVCLAATWTLQCFHFVAKSTLLPASPPIFFCPPSHFCLGAVLIQFLCLTHLGIIHRIYRHARARKLYVLTLICLFINTNIFVYFSEFACVCRPDSLIIYGCMAPVSLII